jgi:hypothetical protein
VKRRPTPGEVFDDLADILSEMLRREWKPDGPAAAFEIVQRLDGPRLPTARQVRRRYARTTYIRLRAEGWPGTGERSLRNMARRCGLSRRQLGRWLEEESGASEQDAQRR